jgi:Nitroreductase
MSDVLNAIVERRSVRKYKDTPVSAEVLGVLLKAAVYAPSARNRQAWHFAVVTNAEARARITETLKSASRHESAPDFLAPLVDTPTYSAGYDAPALIIVSGEREWSTTVCDCALAAGNIMLAAHAYGLGSCWINQLNVVCDVPEFRTLLSELGVPAAYRVYASVCVGYPDGERPQAPERVPGVVHFVA